MKKYREVIADLDQRGIMPERIPSLTPTQAGLEAIGFYTWPIWKKIEQNPETVIVVAGTNGKGSTSATLEALLTHAGERVGLYTSPHLMEITERIRILGRDVTPDIFIKAFDAIESRTRHLSLSHFEMLTLMALWCFGSGEKLPIVDRIILEVGMGGTWDATNAVPHGIAVITALSIDHEKFLGKSLPEIAKNKFGIIGRNMRVFHQPLAAEVLKLAEQVKQSTKSQWTESLKLPFEVKTFDGEPRWMIRFDNQSQAIQLPGARGVENTNLALTVFQGLGYSIAKNLSALEKVNWPGRMEKLKYKDCQRVYLSGDHNVQGIQSLIELLKHYTYNTLHAVVGVGKEKDFQFILEALKGLPHTKIYLTETPFRGRKLTDYGTYVDQVDYCNANFEVAFDEAYHNSTPGDLLLVTGSLYLVGDIRKYIKTT